MSQRQNDKNIMEEKILLSLTQIQRGKITTYRLYFQITHLSDTIKPDG